MRVLLLGPIEREDLQVPIYQTGVTHEQVVKHSPPGLLLVQVPVRVGHPGSQPSNQSAPRQFWRYKQPHCTSILAWVILKR